MNLQHQQAGMTSTEVRQHMIAGNLMAYAQKRYGKSATYRWDMIVECWNRKEVFQELREQGIKTYVRAEAHFRGIVRSYAEQDRSIRAEAF